MKLKKARITNFRSVENSELFSLEHSTCLVGKNEAGKTAILLALAGLNSHRATPFEYEIERDYPKRFLARYNERHEDEDALVIETEWEIDTDTKEKIIDEFGEDALIGTAVTITRNYNSIPRWQVPISTVHAINNLISNANFSASEKSQLGPHNTSISLKSKLEELAPTNEKYQILHNKISKYPNQDLLSRIQEICEIKFPYFMYFSNYDRMNAVVQLDKLKVEAENNTLFSEPNLRGGSFILGIS